jgi:hypothetical protein
VKFVVTKERKDNWFFPLLFCCCYWIRDPGWIKIRFGNRINSRIRNTLKNEGFETVSVETGRYGTLAYLPPYRTAPDHTVRYIPLHPTVVLIDPNVQDEDDEVNSQEEDSQDEMADSQDEDAGSQDEDAGSQDEAAGSQDEAAGSQDEAAGSQDEAAGSQDEGRRGEEEESFRAEADNKSRKRKPRKAD